MSEQLKLEYLLEMEKKYNLYNDIIDGINYWIYSRFDVWEGIILKEQLGLGIAHVGKTKSKQRIKIYFDLLRRSFFKGKYQKRNIDVCFLYSSSDRKKINGYYECCYTASLEKDFRNNIVLEFPFLLEHNTPMRTADLIYLDYIFVRQEVVYRICKTFLKRKYRELKKKIKEKLDAPLVELESTLQTKLNIDEIENAVAKQIIYYKAVINNIKKMVSKLQPKVIVEVCAYSSICMMINEVCKEKGIKTIELQHGTVNEHLAYNYLTKEVIMQVPDYVFLFSEFWKKHINLPIKEENLIVTGFPYLEESLENISVNSHLSDGKKNILFLSQGPIGRKLSDLAIGLAQKLNQDEYRILYKLHPGEKERYEKEYKKLEKYGIEVIYNEDNVLYEFFANSEAQVGVYSTAIYEGLRFGLNTYVYKVERSEIMEELCDLGYARYVNNCEELYKYIMEEISAKQKGNIFWRENARENMKEAIKNIL